MFDLRQSDPRKYLWSKRASSEGAALFYRLRYRELREDGWSLTVDSDSWSPALWRVVLTNIHEQVPSRHPQTLKLNLPESQQQSYFLKVYHPASWWSTVKDWFRASKALRFLEQGMALSGAANPRRKSRWPEASPPRVVLRIGCYPQPLDGPGTCG